MAIIRNEKNPLITVNDIKASREDFEVLGVFNPGVTKYQDETVLLLRVAERPISYDDSKCYGAIYNTTAKILEVKSFDKDDESIDFSDPRIIKTPEGTFLTSISHLRLAKTQDGIKFEIDDKPFVEPDTIYETYGTEDSRITQIGDTFYVNYSCASEVGITTCLASTKDFETVTKEWVIFCPDNKDVTIFPEKINGYYYALHRPSASHFGKPEIWIAKSTDLLCWGEHRHVAAIRPESWDNGRIGASAVPFKTPHGWIEIYHGATDDDQYCIGALLLDLDEPWKVIARSEKPLLEPEAFYEVNGFFENVVFACGALVAESEVRIYYGAADDSVASVDMTLDDIYENLGVLVKH